MGNFPAQLVENVACMRERKEESSLFSYSDFSTRGVDSQRQSRQAERTALSLLPASLRAEVLKNALARQQDAEARQKIEYGVA
jgi:hypothetical protein